MSNQNLTIIENGEQMDVTEAQANELLSKGIIYDSGEGYYHINDADGYSWTDVEAVTN